MCNKTEDLKRRDFPDHQCPYCTSEYSEILDLLAHIKETHEK